MPLFVVWTAIESGQTMPEKSQELPDTHSETIILPRLNPPVNVQKSLTYCIKFIFPLGEAFRLISF